MIRVIGLGPAGPELVAPNALAAIAAVAPSRRFVRTARHPSASVVEGASTFDDAYDAEPTFEAVYRRIADTLLAVAQDGGGDVVYAVPGSPRVLERTVDLLAQEATAGGVEVEVLPGVSFVDLAWVRLGVDPFEAGVRLVDGHRFAERAAGERGPLLVAHCHDRFTLADVKLALDLDGPPVVVLQRLGSPDESITTVAREDLDRVVTADHLTSLWIPDAAAPVASEVARFDELVHTLRARCPWDREQTHRSLTRHLLEETYEVLDAIEALDLDTGRGYEHLEEELGDLLFQICFHTTLAAEEGAFTLADVARGIHAKLVRRHPHVFGDDTGSHTPESLSGTWEALKKEEKGHASVFDGIPDSLPSLLYAHKVLRKAQTVGVDVEPAVVDAGAVGDALLAVVAAARRHEVDPEAALRAAARRLAEAGRVAEA